MNLNEYWPDFIKSVLEFQKIADAIQPEFDSFLSELERAPDDFFISTLTENGVKRWEKIFGIVPPEGESVDSRRSRLVIRYTDQIPYTYRAMIRYLKTLTTSFTAEVLHNDYAVKIGISLENMAHINTLEDALRKMVPANMVLEFSTRYIMAARASPASGLNFSHTGVIHTQPKTITAAVSTAAGAAAGVNYASIRITGSQPPPIENDFELAAGAAASANYAHFKF